MKLQLEAMEYSYKTQEMKLLTKNCSDSDGGRQYFKG